MATVVIKKISYVDRKVTIDSFHEGLAQKQPIESIQEPLPEFKQALQKFKKVVERLPFDFEDIEQTVIKSVHLKRNKSDGELIAVKVGFTVYQMPDDEGLQHTLNLTSDYFALEEDDEASELVDGLITEAKRYLRGERAQGDMFVDSDNGEQTEDQPEESEPSGDNENDPGVEEDDEPFPKSEEPWDAPQRMAIAN